MNMWVICTCMWWIKVMLSHNAEYFTSCVFLCCNILTQLLLPYNEACYVHLVIVCLVTLEHILSWWCFVSLGWYYCDGNTDHSKHTSLEQQYYTWSGMHNQQKSYQLCVYYYYLVFFSYIRTDASQETTLSIPLGNVTVDTELTYEFGVRKDFKFSTQPQEGTL